MTAGRGIIHRELAFRNERAHTLQLWVNLPGELKMAGTRYQDLRGPTARSSIATAPHRPDLRRRRRHLRAGAEQLADLRDPDHPGAQPQPRISATGRDRAFFYVVAGEVTVAGHDAHRANAEEPGAAGGGHIYLN